MQRRDEGKGYKGFGTAAGVEHDEKRSYVAAIGRGAMLLQTRLDSYSSSQRWALACRTERWCGGAKRAAGPRDEASLAEHLPPQCHPAHRGMLHPLSNASPLHGRSNASDSPVSGQPLALALLRSAGNPRTQPAHLQYRTDNSACAECAAIPLVSSMLQERRCAVHAASRRQSRAKGTVYERRGVSLILPSTQSLRLSMAWRTLSFKSSKLDAQCSNSYYSVSHMCSRRLPSPATTSPLSSRRCAISTLTSNSASCGVAPFASCFVMAAMLPSVQLQPASSSKFSRKKEWHL